MAKNHALRCVPPANSAFLFPIIRPIPAFMLSAPRTRTLPLQTTSVLLVLFGMALAVFVVQRLAASEAPVPVELAPVATETVESALPLSRQQKAGPQGPGRKLPWVRWEYIP
jgi:hypothetical protein